MVYPWQTDDAIRLSSVQEFALGANAVQRVARFSVLFLLGERLLVSGDLHLLCCVSCQTDGCVHLATHAVTLAA